MKIILVDDDRDSLKSLSKFLNYAGFEIESFSSPQTALDFVKTGRCYDFIISDYKMPLLNGVELIREVSILLPKINTVIYTGYDDFNIIREIKNNNIDFFFKKPINLNKLIKILQEEKVNEKLQSY